MRIALVIPPKDFRDESVSKVKSLLEKWNAETVISSFTSHDCIGYHGAVYKPDINAAKLDPEEYDAMVLFDGIGVDTYKLFEFRPFLDIVKLFEINGKKIAAIGNAIKIIARANIISNKRISMPSDEESQRLVRLYRGIGSTNAVEADGNIFTSGDPKNADALANKILESLGAF
ncbi:MAG: DJ-1/PfpI family protein [Candidatus Micrarchaeaceae archaeon]